MNKLRNSPEYQEWAKGQGKIRWTPPNNDVDWDQLGKEIYD